MPSWACSQRSLSRLISWSRPVSGESSAGAAASIRLPATRDSSHPEELDGLRHALDLLAAEAGALELALEQPVGGLGADDLAGHGHSSSRTATFRASPTSETDVLLRLHDGRPGVDADPRIQLQLVLAAEPLAEGLQVLEDAEAGPCGAACGVLVGHRVAEARQQPLLVALHDRPVERPHGLLAGLLEGPQHLGLILRVEVSRYASDSNRSQPQTRTVTWRRSASRARRRDEVGVDGVRPG